MGRHGHDASLDSDDAGRMSPILRQPTFRTGRRPALCARPRNRPARAARTTIRSGAAGKGFPGRHPQDRARPGAVLGPRRRPPSIGAASSSDRPTFDQAADPSRPPRQAATWAGWRGFATAPCQLPRGRLDRHAGSLSCLDSARKAAVHPVTGGVLFSEMRRSPGAKPLQMGTADRLGVHRQKLRDVHDLPLLRRRDTSGSGSGVRSEAFGILSFST